MKQIEVKAGTLLTAWGWQWPLAVNALICTGIALFLWTIDVVGTLHENLAVSYCIGFCILLAVEGIANCVSRFSPFVRGLGVLLGITLGSLAGTFLGFNLIGASSFISPGNPAWRRTVFIALTFGVIVSWFYYSLIRFSEAASAAKEAELKQANYGTQLAQAELKMLQAQIEPHFLYNTLANVRSLMESRPQTAATMLENLIGFLQSSLTHSRAGQVPLKDEIGLLRAYLDIMAVRMGERLQYSIDMDGGLGTVPFPPMLLQPLVENAVKHGLEPKVEGGAIHITARGENGLIRIAVSDTGAGFPSDKADGFGLNNVRSRLRSIYGDRARLELTAGAEGGVTAAITVPGET